MLALDLTVLKFNGILTIDFIEIQFKGEWRFSESKFGHDAKEKAIKGACIEKGFAKVAL